MIKGRERRIVFRKSSKSWGVSQGQQLGLESRGSGRRIAAGEKDQPVSGAERARPVDRAAAEAATTRVQKADAHAAEAAAKKSRRAKNRRS